MNYIVEVWRGKTYYGLAPWAYKIYEDEFISRRDAERCAKDIAATDNDIACYIVEKKTDYEYASNTRYYNGRKFG